MEALLVSGGTIEDLVLLKELSKNIDLVIGVDRGAEYCLDAQVLPHIVVGDLDSIGKEKLEIIKGKEIPVLKYPSEKNKTDTELAIDYLIKKGVKKVTILGALGSRMDHVLANILLLKKLKGSNIKSKILDRKNTIYLVDNELSLEKEEGSYVSIIPLNDEGIMVTLEGFKYDLEKTKVGFTSTLGISNEIEKPYAKIKIYKGVSLVLVTKD